MKEQLLNVEAAVQLVASKPRAERTKLVGELLAGQVDVGSRAKPNLTGKALLHRRALFVTELHRQKVWAG